MPNDSDFLRFTEEWWNSFTIYEEEDGRAYVRHLFEYVHKRHFVAFLRDAFAELTIADD